jgi:hypothetical protein
MKKVPLTVGDLRVLIGAGKPPLMKVFPESECKNWPADQKSLTSRMYLINIVEHLGHEGVSDTREATKRIIKRIGQTGRRIWTRDALAAEVFERISVREGQTDRSVKMAITSTVKHLCETAQLLVVEVESL